MDHPRPAALLGAACLLSLVLGAGIVAAGAGVNEILFTYSPGFPFGGRFTDPTGFTCVNGSFPQHDPPNAFERRCTSTFGGTQCTDLEAEGRILGLLARSSLEVISACSNAVDPPVAGWCAATGPAYPATCTGASAGGTVGAGYTFFCHVKPSGAAFFFGATCRATTP